MLLPFLHKYIHHFRILSGSILAAVLYCLADHMEGSLDQRPTKSKVENKCNFSNYNFIKITLFQKHFPKIATKFSQKNQN